MDIGIIGLGIVGNAVKYGFEKIGHVVKVHDIILDTTINDVLETEVCYICVPTPENEDDSCNTSIVEDVVRELVELNYNGVITIKSTVEPGTTVRLKEKYNINNVCFVPEFLRERCAITDFTENHDICIVGTEDDFIFEQIKKCHGKYPKKFIKVGETAAELCKYYNNIYNATLITFANSFYEVCKKLNVNYSEVKDAVVNINHITDLYLDCNENFRGFGGVCLTPGSKIYTKNGLKCVEDIKCGDKVLTHTGNYRAVTDIFSREVNESLYNIKVQGITDKIMLTGNHPILASNNNRKLYMNKGKLKLSSMKNKTVELSWIDAANIQKGDFVSFPTPKEKDVFKDFNGDVARLIGYYIAEGNLEKRYYVNKKGNKNPRSFRTQFTFHAKEVKYHKDVCDIIKLYFNKSPKVKIIDNKCIIRVSGKALYDLFFTYGGVYSYAKKIPWNFINNVNNKILSNLLIGYFRGDGSFSGERYTCATVSKLLFEQLKFILFKLQLPFTTKIGKARVDKNGVNHRKSYYITIANEVYIKKFSEMLEDNALIYERKKSKTTLKLHGDKILYTVKNVEIVPYKGMVYNIGADKDNSYVTYGGIVHNCLPKDTKAIDSLCRQMFIDVDFFQMIIDENNKYKVTVFDGMRK